jgi:hypothetical protein
MNKPAEILDRGSEWAEFVRIWQRRGPGLLLVLGRRRVGKSDFRCMTDVPNVPALDDCLPGPAPGATPHFKGTLSCTRRLTCRELMRPIEIRRPQCILICRICRGGGASPISGHLSAGTCTGAE